MLTKMTAADLVKYLPNVFVESADVQSVGEAIDVDLRFAVRTTQSAGSLWLLDEIFNKLVVVVIEQFIDGISSKVIEKPLSVTKAQMEKMEGIKVFTDVKILEGVTFTVGMKEGFKLSQKCRELKYKMYSKFDPKAIFDSFPDLQKEIESALTSLRGMEATEYIFRDGLPVNYGVVQNRNGDAVLVDNFKIRYYDIMKLVRENMKDRYADEKNDKRIESSKALAGNFQIVEERKALKFFFSIDFENLVFPNMFFRLPKNDETETVDWVLKYARILNFEMYKKIGDLPMKRFITAGEDESGIIRCGDERYGTIEELDVFDGEDISLAIRHFSGVDLLSDKDAQRGSARYFCKIEILDPILRFCESAVDLLKRDIRLLGELLVEIKDPKNYDYANDKIKVYLPQKFDVVAVRSIVHYLKIRDVIFADVNSYEMMAKMLYPFISSRNATIRSYEYFIKRYSVLLSIIQNRIQEPITAIDQRQKDANVSSSNRINRIIAEFELLRSTDEREMTQEAKTVGEYSNSPVVIVFDNMEERNTIGFIDSHQIDKNLSVYRPKHIFSKMKSKIIFDFSQKNKLDSELLGATTSFDTAQQFQMAPQTKDLTDVSIKETMGQGFFLQGNKLKLTLKDDFVPAPEDPTILKLKLMEGISNQPSTISATPENLSLKREPLASKILVKDFSEMKLRNLKVALDNASVGEQEATPKYIPFDDGVFLEKLDKPGKPSSGIKKVSTSIVATLRGQK